MLCMLHQTSRADAEHDAVILDRIVHGARTYTELAETDTRERLDASLDRLLDAGYIRFRFTGRAISVSDTGGIARTRAHRRGWRHGQLVDARDLYPSPARRAQLNQ